MLYALAQIDYLRLSICANIFIQNRFSYFTLSLILDRVDGGSPMRVVLAQTKMSGFSVALPSS